MLSNEVECDEAYVIAGHKGQPEVVKSKGRKGRQRRLKGKAGRGTLEKERPPVFGMIQRGGQVVINLMANVKQKTIEPFMKDTIVPGTLVYTDEYSIYRNHRKTPSFSYGDIRWCLRSRQSISSEVRGVTMKPLALAMGRSHGIGLLSLRQGGLHRALPQLERAMGICQDADLPVYFSWMVAAL